MEVVDGDTLRVRSGREIRTVRLIGIDAPERSHPTRPEEYLAAEAAAHLALLCEGKTVRMEADREETDRYGRLLRYVFLHPEGRLVNRDMLHDGYARVYRRFPFSRLADFRAAEEEARRENRGIWRDGGMAEVRWLIDRRAPAPQVLPMSGELFAVLHAGMAKTGIERDALSKAIPEIVRLRSENSDRDFREKARAAGYSPLAGDAVAPSGAAAGTAKSAPSGREVVSWEDAHRHAGREVVVEGTIVRTHRSGKVLYLNFHPNWKKYVNVVIFAKDLAGFPRQAETFYKGKTVRVKGTISLYKGRPELVVKTPEAIEVVE